ncbi:MAG: hypothetical protein WCR42_11805 [bacterium]
MKRFLTLCAIIIMAITVASADPDPVVNQPLRISIIVPLTPPPAPGNLVIDVLTSSGTQVTYGSGTPLSFTLDPEDYEIEESGTLSYVLEGGVWADHADYVPHNLIRITYKGIVYSIERMEVMYAKQGLYGAYIDNEMIVYDDGEHGIMPSIDLTNSADQIIFQSAGVTGTLSWTPTGTAKRIYLPNIDGTLATLAGTENLTGKTYNGLTITNNGTNTLNIAAGKVLTVTNDATVSGSNTGDNAVNSNYSSLVTMTYPGAGIPLSTGTAWGTSITDNSANWNTAYGWGTHTGLYTPIAHQTTENAIDGIVHVNGAGAYSAAVAADFPTLNQSTSGTAANVTGVVAGANGGTGINNGTNTIDIEGNITTAGAFIITGAYSTTLNATALTSVTLPTSGTLATLAGDEDFTNKKYDGLTLASLATSFTIAGGTEPVTLTVNGTGSVSGSNTGDQNAAGVSIADAGNIITATTVEGALQENRAAINLNTAKVTMTYPGAGIPLSTGTAWGTSITDNSANWNTAYGWGTHTGLYTPIAHQTTENAIDGIVHVNGAGAYSAAIAADFPTLNQNTSGTAANVTGVVAGANGGTGIANSGKTITLGGDILTAGDFTTTGAFSTTLVQGADVELTLPLVDGTLATLANLNASTLQTAYNNGLAADPATRTISTTGGPIIISQPTALNTAMNIFRAGTTSAIYNGDGDVTTPGSTPVLFLTDDAEGIPASDGTLLQLVGTDVTPSSVLSISSVNKGIEASAVRIETSEPESYGLIVNSNPSVAEGYSTILAYKVDGAGAAIIAQGSGTGSVVFVNGSGTVSGNPATNSYALEVTKGATESAALFVSNESETVAADNSDPENPILASTATALQVGNGRVVLAAAEATTVAALKSMGNFSVIRFTSITESTIDSDDLPAGADGQIIYIINNTPGALSICGTTSYDFQMTTVVCYGGVWYPNNM